MATHALRELLLRTDGFGYGLISRKVPGSPIRSDLDLGVWIPLDELKTEDEEGEGWVSN